MNHLKGAKSPRDTFCGRLSPWLTLLILLQYLGFFSTSDAKPFPVTPSVIIIKPEEGATFKHGSNVQLAAGATELHGNVLRVDYYEGAYRIASSHAPEFRALWFNPGLGQHSI